MNLLCRQLPEWRSYVPKGPAQVETEYAYGQVYLYMHGSPVHIQTPQHDRHVVFVIAQQYSSSATFVLLRFQSRKEKFGARFRNVSSNFVYISSSQTFSVYRPLGSIYTLTAPPYLFLKNINALLFPILFCI
jgi:hypothetical protein